MRHGPQCGAYRFTTPPVRCTGVLQHAGRHRWRRILWWTPTDLYRSER